MTPDEFVKALQENAEDYEPTPNKVIVEGDFRPRVILPGHGGRLLSDFASELGDHLRDKPIFNRGGVVSVLDQEKKKLKMVSGSAFRSTVERSLGIVCQNWVGRGKECRLED